MRLIFGLALAAWAARATVVHERGVAARAVTTTTFSRFIGPQHFSLNCSNKTQVVKLRKASLCDAAALAKYDLKGKIVVSKLHWACEMEGQHRRLAKLGVALWLTKTKTTKMPSIHWNYHYRFIKWRADKAPPLLSVVERVGWRGVLAHGGHVVFEPDRNCWKDLFQSPLYQAVCRGLFGGGKAVGAALGCIAIRARLRNDAWLWLPLAALTLETLSLAILSALWLVGAGYADPALPFWMQYICMTGLLGSRLAAGLCASLFWLHTAKLFSATVKPSLKAKAENPFSLGVAAVGSVVTLSMDFYMVAANVDSVGFFLGLYTLGLVVVGGYGLIGGVVFLRALRRRLRKMDSQRASRGTELYAKLARSFKRTTMWMVASSLCGFVFAALIIFLTVSANARGSFEMKPDQWFIYASFLDVLRSMSSFCSIMALDFRGDVAEAVRKRFSAIPSPSAALSKRSPSTMSKRGSPGSRWSSPSAVLCRWSPSRSRSRSTPGRFEGAFAAAPEPPADDDEDVQRPAGAEASRGVPPAPSTSPSPMVRLRRMFSRGVTPADIAAESDEDTPSRAPTAQAWSPSWSSMAGLKSMLGHDVLARLPSPRIRMPTAKRPVDVARDSSWTLGASVDLRYTLAAPESARSSLTHLERTSSGRSLSAPPSQRLSDAQTGGAAARPRRHVSDAAPKAPLEVTESARLLGSWQAVLDGFSPRASPRVSHVSPRVSHFSPRVSHFSPRNSGASPLSRYSPRRHSSGEPKAPSDARFSEDKKSDVEFDFYDRPTDVSDTRTATLTRDGRPSSICDEYHAAQTARDGDERRSSL